MAEIESDDIKMTAGPMMKTAVGLTNDILRVTCDPNLITLVLPKGITFFDNIVPIMDAEEILEMIAPVKIVEV